MMTKRQTNEGTSKVHVFERAGLGKAPYRFLGVEERRGPLTMPDGSQVGAPGQPMGCCNYCSTGIAYCYWLESADGKKFYVGSECILKTHPKSDPLHEVIKTDVKKRQKELRAKKQESKREARRQQWETERQQRIAKFEADNADLFKRTAPYMSDRVINDIITRARQWGNITPGQLAYVVSIIKRLEAQHKQAAASNYVGTVGQRFTTRVVVTRLGKYSRPAYGYYGRYAEETVWVVTMEDAQGNVIVSKTPTFKREVGERFDLTGTVKAHTEYQGAKQTVVTRPVAK